MSPSISGNHANFNGSGHYKYAVHKPKNQSEKTEVHLTSESVMGLEQRYGAHKYVLRRIVKLSIQVRGALGNMGKGAFAHSFFLERRLHIIFAHRFPFPSVTTRFLSCSTPRRVQSEPFFKRPIYPRIVLKLKSSSE
jgi:hypothetical protein